MAKKSSSGPRGASKRGQHKPATPAKSGRRAYTLANLQPPVGSRKKKVRVGRGIGSKLGKTAGAGNKGQKSRKGFSRRPGFEGGQTPIQRRLRKLKGVSQSAMNIGIFRKEYAIVNVGQLDVFEPNTVITPDLLVKTRIIREVREGLRVRELLGRIGGDEQHQGGPTRGASATDADDASVRTVGAEHQEHLEAGRNRLGVRMRPSEGSQHVHAISRPDGAGRHSRFHRHSSKSRRDERGHRARALGTDPRRRHRLSRDHVRRERAAGHAREGGFGARRRELRRHPLHREHRPVELRAARDVPRGYDDRDLGADLRPERL